MIGRRVDLRIVVIVVGLTGCGPRDPYVCSTSDQCVSGNLRGVCEPTHFCSFPDPECGGRKYEPNAGEYAGQCVPSSCTNPVVELGFGRRHACALRSDHTVWCIGNNEQGEVGTGSVSPTRVVEWTQVRDDVLRAPITDATGLGVGAEHSCAVRAGGAVWCWGSNDSGQLGNRRNDNPDRASPLAVEVSMVGGQPLRDIVEVHGGHDHTCARHTAGTVWCWGTNSHGQLGDGMEDDSVPAEPGRDEAGQVLTALMGSAFSGATQLIVRHHNNCVRTAAGQFWCWGNNDEGQLGTNDTAVKLVPVSIPGAWSSMDVGNRRYTCRVDPNGAAWCAGASDRGRLGNNVARDDLSNSQSIIPIAVLTGRYGSPLTGVASVHTGSAACALLVDGTLQCWGANSHGHVGTRVSTGFPLPVLDANGQPLGDVVDVTAAYAHTCAHRSSGDILCWGSGLDGELGDGVLEDHPIPTRLRFPCP